MSNDQLQRESKSRRKLGVYGAIGSAIYLVGLTITILIGYYQGWMQIGAISLNELGDFLAGAFGPLALGWLVLGFFQQGHELRLQVEEMANSVEQQQELVAVSQSQLDLEIQRRFETQRDQEQARMPNFILRFENGSVVNGTNFLKIQIINNGGLARRIRFSIQGDIARISPSKTDIVRKSESFFVELSSKSLIHDSGIDNIFEIEALDEDDHVYHQSFLIGKEGYPAIKEKPSRAAPGPPPWGGR